MRKYSVPFLYVYVVQTVYHDTEVFRDKSFGVIQKKFQELQNGHFHKSWGKLPIVCQKKKKYFEVGALRSKKVWVTLLYVEKNERKKIYILCHLSREEWEDFHKEKNVKRFLTFLIPPHHHSLSSIKFDKESFYRIYVYVCMAGMAGMAEK